MRWVLIVERRYPGRNPVVSPYGYEELVFGPFESEADAWLYANSRDENDADELTHEVTELREPTDA